MSYGAAMLRVAVWPSNHAVDGRYGDGYETADNTNRHQDWLFGSCKDLPNPQAKDDVADPKVSFRFAFVCHIVSMALKAVEPRFKAGTI